jgi:DNA-binding CsgD family transcriptional regulator
MLGLDDEYLGLVERAHHAYLDAGDLLRAARCAVWIGINLALRGEVGPATGWFGRAQRLVERERRDCVEHGYLLLQGMFRHEAAGDWEAAFDAAAEAATIGEGFGDRDLVTMARHVQGRARAKQGRLHEGLALLDEAMVSVTAGELSPIVTGLVYCSVIEACQEVYAIRRAREWTAALTSWCAGQPGLVAFTGACLVHRVEIMRLAGAWDEALAEARRASRRLAQQPSRRAVGQALYFEGEVKRLQGEFDAAEDVYRQASVYGWEPQPGLALLRLAQGRIDAAAAAIQRAAGEAAEPLDRAKLLPAYVEIMLARGDAEQAQTAARELDEIAGRFDESGMLGAVADHARGAVSLAQGDPGAALAALRRSWRAWQELEAPYEAARVRVLLAEACHVLGDDEAATLELEGARHDFADLGAAPDLARLDSLAGPGGGGDAHGLTARELQVLRLVAAGRSNREIASELVISEHTVARHVQNIFAKLRVSSRTAASAFAYEHDLV